MAFDNVIGKFNKAGHATEAYIKKKWESRPAAEAERRRRRRVEEQNRLLRLVAAKVTGSSMVEMPRLVCDPNAGSCSSKAVFLVTMPISFGCFELSRNTYRLLARHLGMSLNSVCHWALCVVDRCIGGISGGGPGQDTTATPSSSSSSSSSSPPSSSYCYDLMSDQLAPIHALGRNYFRVAEITPAFIENWTSCYYVGETTKSHEVIQQLGTNFMNAHPRYNLLTNNCQNLVENLVRLLCDGRVISQPMLNEELSLVSPKIARDLMVAKLRSKLEAANGEERNDLQEDVDAIKALWHKVHR